MTTSVDWEADAEHFGRTTSVNLEAVTEPDNVYASSCKISLNPLPFSRYWCGSGPWGPNGCGTSSFNDAGYLSPVWRCKLSAGNRTYQEALPDDRLYPQGSIFASLNDVDIPFTLQLQNPGIVGQANSLNWLLTSPFDLCQTTYRYTETDSSDNTQTYLFERTYDVRVEYLELSILNAYRAEPIGSSGNNTGQGTCTTGRRIIFSQTLTGSTTTGTPLTGETGFDEQCYGQDQSVIEAWDNNTVGPPYKRLLQSSTSSTWSSEYQQCSYDPTNGDLKWPQFMYGEPKWGVGVNVDYHLTYDSGEPLQPFPWSRCVAMDKTNRYHSTSSGLLLYPDWPQADLNGRGQYYTEPSLVTRAIPSVFIDFVSTI